jgi:dTDP-4-amino-4,6-dideoxygalactose transaminase
MNKKNIPLFKVFMAKDAIDPLKEILQSGYIGQGPKVDEFEKSLSNYIGNPYANTVNSATSGLHLALHLIKKNYGSEDRNEVITTPLTCTATNFPILANGLKIKWADIDPLTCNIDLNDVERKINKKTLAIMLVHWGGMPVNLDKIEEIKEKTLKLFNYKIPVIEDCAHAFGSKYKNKMIGNSNNFCVFSFQAIKHLTTGDGGLLLSPNSYFHEQAKLIRWFGLDRTSSADFRCLHPKTLIRFEDNKTHSISDVVNKKITGNVMVVEKGKLIPKKITGWHKNDLKNRKLLSISTKKFNSKNKTIVTEDHLIYTKKGWIKASDLKKGQKILTSFPSPNETQIKIIIGSLLGSGNIFKNKKSKLSRYQEKKDSNNEEYLKFKAEILSGLGSCVFCSSENKKSFFELKTNDIPAFSELRKKFYKVRKKVIPKKLILKHFSPLMLASWFCDSGSTKVKNKNCQINISNFLKKDVNWLVKLLCEKKYFCKIKKISSGFTIYFNKEGTANLLNEIQDYIPHFMKNIFKIDSLYFNKNLWGEKESCEYYDKSIIKIYKNKNENFVYCLSVEGSVPMISTNSIMVHNCEQNINDWGYKFHMNDISASIGLSNIKHVNEIVSKHHENYKYLKNELSNEINGIKFLQEDEFSYSSSWIMTILVENRNDFMKKMKDCGIGVSQVHDRNDKHKCLSEFKSILPNTDYVSKKMCCIPCGWWVTEEDREYIIKCIKEGW